MSKIKSKKLAKHLSQLGLVNKSMEPPTPAPAFHGVIAGKPAQGRGNQLLSPNPLGGDRNIARLQYLAYQKSRYLAMVVDLIANAASKKWHLERKDGTENDTDEAALIESFLNCPNDDDTFPSLNQSIMRDLLVFGGCILEFHTSPVDNQALANVGKALAWLPDVQAEVIAAAGSVPAPGFPTFLEVLPFEQMEILTDSKGRITGYKQWSIDGSVNVFDVTEILHIRHPKSRSKVYGDSPLNPILSTVALDNLITERHLAVLANDMVADSLFILKEGRTVEEANAFYEEIKSKYTSAGSEGGSFLVMASDVEYQAIGQGGKDGEYLKLSEMLRNVIANYYGVAISVLGDTSGTSSTYSAGSNQAYRSFIENAVRPLANHLQAMLNRKLLSHFGAIGLEYIIVFDLLDDDDMADVEKTWDLMLRNGSLTINEVRAARGKQQPVEGGDKPFVYVAKGALLVSELAEGTPDPIIVPPSPVPEAGAAPKPSTNGHATTPKEAAVSKAHQALADLRKCNI